jgi:hypothetical protein
LLRRGVTVVGLAAGQQLLRDLAVACGAAELVDDVAVPIELQPLQAIENGGNGGFSRALAVGVLDPEQHLAAGLPGVEPVEQRGSGASDVEEAGRRGGKARDDGIGHDWGRAYAGTAVVYSRNVHN